MLEIACVNTICVARIRNVAYRSTVVAPQGVLDDCLSLGTGGAAWCAARPTCRAQQSPLQG
jgi:hypothetical protein